MTNGTQRLVYIFGNSAPERGDLTDVFTTVGQAIRDLERAFFQDVDPGVDPSEATDEHEQAGERILDPSYARVYELAEAIAELSARETALLSLACGVRMAEIVTGQGPLAKDLTASPEGLTMSFSTELEYPTQPAADDQIPSRNRVKVFTLVRDEARPANAQNDAVMPIIAVEFVKDGQRLPLSSNVSQLKG